jgi:hypothetical protein
MQLKEIAASHKEQVEGPKNTRRLAISLISFSDRFTD